MNYTSGPKKLAQNVAKHGVWFDIAEAFDWESAVVRVDDRNDYPEVRLIATGRSATVFT